MIMHYLNLKKNKLTNQNQDGFSLVELSVAMLVGIIVFAFAITFLVSFSSSSIKASAKSEVTSKARVAMTRILKDVSNSANVPGCASWTNSTYNESTPVTSSNIDECVELFSTSKSIVYAMDYSLCWYLSIDGSYSSGTITYPTKQACLFAKNGNTFDPVPCKASSQNSAEILYYAECDLSGSVKSDRIIAELGPHAGRVDSVPNAVAKDTRLFQYTNYDSSDFNFGANNKILKITVRISLSYENGKFVNDKKDYSSYIFLQSIELSGVKAFLETGAYGG